jgi:hypothetical protein
MLAVYIEKDSLTERGWKVEVRVIATSSALGVLLQ